MLDSPDPSKTQSTVDTVQYFYCSPPAGARGIGGCKSHVCDSASHEKGIQGHRASAFCPLDRVRLLAESMRRHQSTTGSQLAVHDMDA